MQRADAWIAAPREDQFLGAAHADELIVDEIGRQAHQCEITSSLTNDLVACGKRNEMGKALERHTVSIGDMQANGFG